MKRRQLVAGLGLGSAVSALSGCSADSAAECAKGTAAVTKTIEWTMVTTWPKNYQVLGEGAEKLARLINEMSGGRIKVTVMGAGELVPALQVLDTVASGAVQMGHGVSYYWKGKIPVAPFFGSIPFGLTAQEMNGWLLHGGGLSLWQAIYKKFNVIPFPAGNTGVQMAGWFNREINSLADIKGLKMRIPGLGGEVLKRAGGSPELIPGGEVFNALQMGRIDAAEWVGPHNDLAFGLYKAAKYYYYPGWHEPGATIEVLINEQAMATLPKDLQAIVREACFAANNDMLANYTAKNWQALDALVNKHKVQLKRLPDDVLQVFKTLADDVVKEYAAGDTLAEDVVKSFRAFRDNARRWSDISDLAYMQMR